MDEVEETEEIGFREEEKSMETRKQEKRKKLE